MNNYKKKPRTRAYIRMRSGKLKEIWTEDIELKLCPDLHLSVRREHRGYIVWERLSGAKVGYHLSKRRAIESAERALVYKGRDAVWEQIAKLIQENGICPTIGGSW